MASTKQSTSYLEAVFRHHFKIRKSVDIMALMEASISVVAFKHPREFAKRRKAIFGDCFDMTKTTQDDDHEEDDDDDEEGEIQDDHTTVHEVQKNTDTSTKVVEEAAAKNPKATIDANDEKMMQTKLESTKRNLHQMYEEIRKRKRKIQVLDLEDAPQVAPDVSSCSRFKRYNTGSCGYNRCY